MGIVKTIKRWIYKIKHFDALEKQCKMLKSELNDVIRLNYNASMHRMLQDDYEKLSIKHDFTCKVLSDTERNYRNVCQENRHLEKEIERLKNYRA